MSGLMSEFEKMRQGLPFDPADECLAELRSHMRDMELVYNQTARRETKKRSELLKEMLGAMGKDVLLLPDIHFDYGCNSYIGDNFFANVNSTFIDVGRITIGNDVMLGPNVTLCTATHPILARERLGGGHPLEYTHPIVIEDRVWIGAGVIVNPGVRIGADCVIGSGSVVTGDIPPGTVAAGVPCRVLREITEADSLANKGY